MTERFVNNLKILKLLYGKVKWQHHHYINILKATSSSQAFQPLYVSYNYCNDNVTVIHETTFYILFSPFCNLPNVNSSMRSSTGSGPPLLLMEVEAYCHNPVGYRWTLLKCHSQRGVRHRCRTSITSWCRVLQAIMLSWSSCKVNMRQCSLCSLCKRHRIAPLSQTLLNDLRLSSQLVPLLCTKRQCLTNLGEYDCW